MELKGIRQKSKQLWVLTEKHTQSQAQSRACRGWGAPAELCRRDWGERAPAGLLAWEGTTRTFPSNKKSLCTYLLSL